MLHEVGQALRIEETPQPVPEADEVLLRVEACGVCHSDLHLIHGDWPAVASSMQLPATLGHEVVGRVVEKGPSVQNLELGDRVGVGWLRWTCGECEPCRDGYENLCMNRQITGIGSPGGYAEYMRAKASHAIKVPDGLSPHEAAPFFCAGVTVYHACRDANIGAGHSVAVFGVGGLGHLAVQFARVLGAQTIAVDVNERALELARSLGADRTVDAASPDAVGMITDGGGVHVAFVTAPAEGAYAQALRCLRKRGKLVVVGIPKNDLTFFADDVVTGEFRIIGSAVGTREELRAALELAAADQVRCEVETYPLQDINEVLRRVRNGEIAGRAAVTF